MIAPAYLDVCNGEMLLPLHNALQERITIDTSSGLQTQTIITERQSVQGTW